MRGIWLRFLALVLAFIITVSASGCGVIWDKPDNKIIYFSEEESTD